MPENAAIRAKVDDLALKLLLIEGPAPEETLRLFSETLAGIGEEARSAGYDGMARLAAEVCGNASSLDAFREGLMQLQQQIENESLPAPPPAGPGPLQDRELISDFVLEVGEHLLSIERQSLTLEKDPANKDAIHSLFRNFHSIKGLAGFLELADVQETAHELETALDRARNGSLAITPAVIDVILASRDYLARAVAGLETVLAGGQRPEPAGTAELVARIRQLTAGAAVQPGPATPAPERPGNSEEPPRAAEAFSVRVDTSRLDYLVDMVGELVIAQSMVRHNPEIAAASDAGLQRSLSQLARVTAEVQRTAMSMRMIPIAQLFQRMARLVRDLGRKAGKPVQLVTSGGDTEVDKTIAEELADPLMHMVRNAIDHGIEPVVERQAAGKSDAARVLLSAYHHGGQVVVELEDDGRGLNRQKILDKGIAKGLIEPGQHADAEIFNLIFEPGFSTAAKVTNLSGRGVGMDVVRRHVQKLRGRIELASEPGRGTRFTIRLPLTLAIIDSLVVAVGSTRYLVPIYLVKEIFRPAPEVLFTVQGRNEMALVHGRLLPIVRLYERFGVRPDSEDPCRSLLIVAECDGRSFCVMVDALLGRQEVVVKSLGEVFRNVQGISGGTILGDGRVGLIVDLEKVFGLAGNG